jgi:hypothetical protein
MKKLLVLAIIILSCIAVSGSVYGAARTVAVSVPQFNITLNGLEYNAQRERAIFNGMTCYFWGGYSGSSEENQGHLGGLQYDRYPFLIYNNITYFPMTYYKCNLLNLDSVWTREGGLSINVGDPSEWSEFDFETSDTKNRKSYTASIAEGTVSVNGTSIDNSKEPYPLLVFREVTYFPLTWRFAVEEFGWRYSYSGDKGLVINADSSFYTEDLPIITVYSKDDLRIWVERRVRGHSMTDPANLYISRGEEVQRVGRQLARLHNMGDNPDDYSCDLFGDVAMDVHPLRFTVQGDWIYTRYAGSLLDRESVPCRVNINTHEIQML